MLGNYHVMDQNLTSFVGGRVGGGNSPTSHLLGCQTFNPKARGLMV